jgi:hypothetical protein
VRRSIDYLKKEPEAALDVVHACAALHDLEASFSILQGYYFGEGDWGKLAPPAGDADRQTSPLFLPPMKELWSDSRFNRLLQRIGLDDYWRQSGTRPDFRRNS